MKKCLVIIDMQKGFINVHTKHLVDKIAKYACTGDFDYVVATRYINHENTACYKFEGWEDCMEGTEDVELVPEVDNLVTRVFDKDKYSCWNSEFREFLNYNEIDILEFVGVNTACCVLHSVFDCYNDVVECRVVADLCGSTSGPDSHERGIKVLEECITKERVIYSGV